MFHGSGQISDFVIEIQVKTARPDTDVYDFETFSHWHISYVIVG